MFKDSQSFETAFQEYYTLLVAFANKQLKDIEASEDVVQDLFVYLFENKSSIKIKESLKAYLYKATFNKCKSHQRKSMTIEGHLAIAKETDTIEFNNQLEQVEFEQRVYHAINSLPPRCKEILILSRFEDKNNSQIAEKLNISKRTVETQISKALKILKQKLTPTDFFLLFF